MEESIYDNIGNSERLLIIALASTIRMLDGILREYDTDGTQLSTQRTHVNEN